MLSFDELYAYRIYYQDFSFDEFYIIKQLKMKLIDTGMNVDESNNYLYEFYKHFGYTIELDEIKSVNIQSNPLSSFLNLLYNNSNLDTIDENEIMENNNNNPENNDELDEQNNIDDPDDLNETNEPTDSEGSTNEDEEISDDELNNGNNLFAEDNSNSQFSNLFNNYVTAVGNYFNNSETENIPQFYFPPINISNDNNPNNNPLPQENLNIVFEYNMNDNVNINNSNLMSQLFTQIINNQNQQEDVNVTLDEKDLKSLKILKYNEDIPSSCSICLMDVEKGDEYYDIKCKHVFHKQCLEKWLEDYNYVCPVCRAELGPSKAHIE